MSCIARVTSRCRPTPAPLRRDAISQELLDEIREANWLDSQLHQYGKSLFERRLVSAGRWLRLNPTSCFTVFIYTSVSNARQ